MKFIPRKLYAKIEKQVIWQILRKWTFKYFKIEIIFF